MGYIYKLLPEIESYILKRKKLSIELSCREIAKEASEKFKLKISKSSVNNVLKKEGLSSAVGRRPKRAVSIEKPLEHGGSFLFKAIDIYLGISSIAAKVLLEIMPKRSKLNLIDVELIIRNFILYYSLFNVNDDISYIYRNIELWSLIGKRPNKSTYKIVAEMLGNSQLFLERMTIELKNYFKPISGYRFSLSDQSGFLVDGQKIAIRKESNRSVDLNVTYYNSSTYISYFTTKNEPFLIFSIPDTNLDSQEFFNLICGFNSDDGMRKLNTIDIVGTNNEIIERKFVYEAKKHFFLAGVWPWQIRDIYEFERKVATERFIVPQLNVNLYYQVEEIVFIQPVTLQRVILTGILFRSSPSGVVKMVILSNIKKENIHKYMKIDKLYNWIEAEQKYAFFSNLEKQNQRRETFFDWFSKESMTGEADKSFQSTVKRLSEIIAKFFQYEILPFESAHWDYLKIKEIVLRQQAEVSYGDGIIVHKLSYNNKLSKKEIFETICQKLNNLSIQDGNKIMYFHVKES